MPEITGSRFEGERPNWNGLFGSCKTPENVADALNLFLSNNSSKEDSKEVLGLAIKAVEKLENLNFVDARNRLLSIFKSRELAGKN